MNHLLGPGLMLEINLKDNVIQIQRSPVSSSLYTFPQPDRVYVNTHLAQPPPWRGWRWGRGPPPSRGGWCRSPSSSERPSNLPAADSGLEKLNVKRCYQSWSMARAVSKIYYLVVFAGLKLPSFCFSYFIQLSQGISISSSQSQIHCSILLKHA